MLTNTVSDLPPFLTARKINAVDCFTDGEGLKAISLFFPSFVQRAFIICPVKGKALVPWMAGHYLWLGSLMAASIYFVAITDSVK
jgi:hypothetical protein